MNRALKLKGRFEKTSPVFDSIAPQGLPARRTVSADDLRRLAGELAGIRDAWPEYGLNANPVVSVYYERVVPKSRRMKRLLSDGESSDKTIVGAKFWYEGGVPRHQIAHCVSMKSLTRSVEELFACAQVVDAVFGGSVDDTALKAMGAGDDEKARYDRLLAPYGIKRTPFTRVVVDTCCVVRFGVDADAPEFDDDVFVTLYKTDLSTRGLFEKLDLAYTGLRSIDDTTLMISKGEYDVLRAKAPYLIAMSLVDWAEVPGDVGEGRTSGGRGIPVPSNEPVIGVIDTLFDEDPDRVYFADWVEHHNLVDSRIPLTHDSFLHGTCVSSIIVDGPALNPLKDDGCGRFRVRHFGVAAGGRFSVFDLVRNLRSIVTNNRDIKVWNLSLGSKLAAPRFSISPIASMLDELQRELDIVFVVAGTNDEDPEEGSWKHLGSPADSVNSLVVNSVRSDGACATYSRRGPVLEFFGKPDVACFGGDRGDPCLTWAPGAEHYSAGTSFAAPWIARKMAYLMQVVGLTREVAKALIIDSAAGWSVSGDPGLVGYGVVPTRIEDVLNAKDDEIRFVISDRAGAYDTYNFNIPVPTHKGKQPYYAKATLCYFPSCSHNQGVDYTNTEIDFKLGRIKDGSVHSENFDMQGEAGAYVREDEARDGFRKWDNVKVIGETVKSQRVPKKTYSSPFWGIKLTSTRRLDDSPREELPFGIVVTLKEMNGVNRVDAFVRGCLSARWIVDEIDIDKSIDVYETAEQEIAFDDE